MIGLFIVYEGSFKDRFRVRQITGETEFFWQVLNPKNLDTSKVKKGSVGTCAFFDTEADAQRVASTYTDKLIKLRSDFLDRRSALLVELRQCGTSAASGGK
jgi:hypothetical protein